MDIPDSCVGAEEPGEHFLLKSGTTVDGVGITAGDWVVVRSQQVVEPGHATVSVADGEARIQPGEIPPGELVVGVVVSVLKQHPASSTEEN